MNKEDLLSEGYLAAYITGELSTSQAKEVEQLLASDPDVRKEFFELQKTLELLAFRHSIAPDLVVKRRVMENPSVTKSFSTNDSSMSSGFKLMMAASVLVALLSLLSAYYFWNQWQSTDARLAELTARNLQLAESYHIVNQELIDIREDLAVIVSPEFSRIILEGTENAPDAKAVIYWNPEQEEVFLNSANLASLPTDQQYQLWALIDGQPVDAGVFDASTGTFQVMKGIANADAFAVTVEPEGGSESPTLSTMQVFGKVS